MTFRTQLSSWDPHCCALAADCLRVPQRVGACAYMSGVYLGTNCPSEAVPYGRRDENHESSMGCGSNHCSDDIIGHSIGRGTSSDDAMTCMD